jgi:hypothetical protein
MADTSRAGHQSGTEDTASRTGLYSGQSRPFWAELCFPLIRVPAMCGENCCREIKEKTIEYWVGSMKSTNNSSSKYISDAKIKEILEI